MSFQFAGLVAIGLSSLAASGHAVGVKGQGTWETTLQARDIDGNGTTDAFYDTELKVTWLATGSMGPMGPMQWGEALTWASQNHFGMAGWRLPKTVDTGTVGCNYGYGGTDCGYNPDSSVETGSEMAHLFFRSLGNKSFYVPGTQTLQAGWGLTNTGEFENLHNHYTHWSGVVGPRPGPYAWVFNTFDGSQNYGIMLHSIYRDSVGSALAVRDGDVVAVPEPQTWALMLAGLGLVAGIARRRSKQQ